ncbi:MAG: hypothetical protein J6T10_08425 [Methanobrevibacter sp.]|nr:hypothetical protein [Methanobrevibacter sp.]
MSKYSFELRELFEPIKFNPPLYTREQIEGWFKDYELSDYLTQEQIDTIEEAGIWNKDKLARKIVNHYYMRESGLETIGLFKHYAKVTMDEIMEEYLPLIYSASISYDPLVNVDYTETFTRNANTNGSSNSSSSSSSSGLVVGSNTPQGQISKANVLAGNYASSTSANENEGNISDTSSSTGTTEESYSKNVKGNSGVSATAQKMVLQYRENIRALDKEIIEKLDILFIGLY